MLKKLFVIIFAAIGIQAESVEFTFDNQSNNGAVYEFDIMAHADNSGTLLGDALLYMNYSTSGFGDNVVANGNIQITKMN